jgi:hypothetical protein
MLGASVWMGFRKRSETEARKLESYSLEIIDPVESARKVVAALNLKA